ncbi:MAG TPA: transporter [Flavobacteriaceae bacterium]|nr:transporter [Alteromonas sp.]HPF12004.1 transporter [Flavobacteriaceae bacterium]HQU21417.1 transporter [Flavobacteriaceae bacterium]HRW45312.1 transporter [Flavobacteriaceae bacterium]
MAFIIALGTMGSLRAQTPSDATLMHSKNICLLFATDFGAFNQYWEGELLRENQTVATVHRYTSTTMAAIGVLDKLDFYVGVPYVTTRSSKPNGGKFAGVSNFQDIIFAAKYQVLNFQSEKGQFLFLTTVGYSTPISDYLSDYKPYSIGLGAPEFSARGILQYKTAFGLFLRGDVAHLWRGYTKAERDYYYNDGSYYTAWMDVPDAWNYEAALGLWCFSNSLKFEVNYFGLKSTSGDDIRPYNAAQPTNKVEVDRVGASIQYFLPRTGFGAIVYHNRVIEGRNVGKSHNTGIGVTYQFSIKKKQHEE